MTRTEILKMVKKIEINSKRIVEEEFSGDYHTRFRGNGMEFEEIREYYEGDDVRNIDWNVTARSDRAYIKKFREERERNIMLLIDVSGSNMFGRKRERIAEIGATLAMSAINNNDKVGVIFFTDKVERFIPSGKGKKHVLAIIEEILEIKPEGVKTDISGALTHFSNYEKKKSIVVLISDFMDTGYEKQVKTLSLKHDMIMVRVYEKAEKKLPKGAYFSIRDMETGEEMVVNAISSEVDTTAEFKFDKRTFLELDANEDFIKPLALFMKRRAK